MVINMYTYLRTHDFSFLTIKYNVIEFNSVSILTVLSVFHLVIKYFTYVKIQINNNLKIYLDKLQISSSVIVYSNVLILYGKSFNFFFNSLPSS